eukprot:243968_1
MATKETCSKPKSSTIEEANINQLCLCGRKLTPYPDECKTCHTCCRVLEEKRKGYYECTAKECTYKQMRGQQQYFMVCGACYQSTNNISNSDAKHSFLFRKVTSFIEQIKKKTAQCHNNDARRRYMYWVYVILFERCIAKLNDAVNPVMNDKSEYEEIEGIFHAFYGETMTEINRNIDLMGLGFASDMWTSEKKRDMIKKGWQKMNKISSE